MAINNCFGCGKLNDTLTCSSSLNGSYLTTNFTCLPCNANLQFCSSCRNPSACTGCISGYTASSTLTCTPCATLLPYCTTYLKCMDNYLLDNDGNAGAVATTSEDVGYASMTMLMPRGRRAQVHCLPTSFTLFQKAIIISSHFSH